VRGAGLILGILFVLVVGYFVVQRSATSGPGQGPPQQQIDVVAIRQRLLAMGQAERQYLVAHGSYATLDELRGDNLLAGGDEQRGYTFSASVSGGDGFTITATPADAGKAGWPTLDISERMEVTQR
jgi:hypothetical protein